MRSAIDSAIKPVRNDRDHAVALTEIERLWSAAPGTPAHDRLEVLATLVDDYEGKRWPIEPPNPIELLEYVMQARGLTRKDLEAAIGSRARVSEVLNRRRHLTLRMAWRLYQALGIPAEALIRPYELRR